MMVSGFLKMERFNERTKSVFIIEQYFKNNNFSDKIIFSDEMIFLMNRLIEKIEDLGFRKSKFRMMKLRDKCIYNMQILGLYRIVFLRKCGWSGNND